MKNNEEIKLDFIKRVASESNTLISRIAEIALLSNEIDQFFNIINEQHNSNPDLFIKMIGDQVYSNYLDLLKASRE